MFLFFLYSPSLSFYFFYVFLFFWLPRLFFLFFCIFSGRHFSFFFFNFSFFYKAGIIETNDLFIDGEFEDIDLDTEARADAVANDGVETIENNVETTADKKENNNDPYTNTDDEQENNTVDL